MLTNNVPKVSIIVPVYMVEEYIDECIKSIIGQKFVDFELILVDDGSPDQSSVICEKYAKEDSRIVVIHKKNGGLSEARNYGLMHAKGEFVSFIDSDDWVDPEMIGELYNACMNFNADIACCGRIIEFGYKQKTAFTLSELIVYDSFDAIYEILCCRTIDVAVWDKLFKRELFSDLNFPINKIHEDFAIIVDLFLKVNKCVHIGKPRYHYRQRDQSITKQKFSLRNIALYENALHVKELLKVYDHLTKPAEGFFYRNIKILYGMILMSDKNKFKNESTHFRKLLINNYLSIVVNPTLSLRDKFVITFQIIGVYTLIKKIQELFIHLRIRL